MLFCEVSVLVVFSRAYLFACGDDDSSFGTSAKGGSAVETDIVVAIFDYLPNCTDNREGKTAFVKEENATYVCTDGDWVADSKTGDEGDGDGDDVGQKSSSSKAKSADSKGWSSGSEGVDDACFSSVIPGSDPESSSSSRDLFGMSKEEFLNPKISYGEMTDERDGKIYKTVKICNDAVEKKRHSKSKAASFFIAYDSMKKTCILENCD